MESFGDKLYRKINEFRSMLFLQGEMAQLTYGAYHEYINKIENSDEETITITYPIGYTSDNQPLNSTLDYTKEKLIQRYEYLGLNKLPLDGIYQLVTIMESLFNDLIREVLLNYPAKISKKRQINSEIVLEAESIEQIKLSIVDSIINDLAYKSPKEFAEVFEKYVGFNLLEHPVYHKYVELKASRDIHIHNLGIVNDIYLNKAGTLARERKDKYLPVNVQYFLQSYEACLQLTELLEKEIDKIWPSAEYQNYKQSLKSKNTQTEHVDEVIEKHSKS